MKDKLEEDNLKMTTLNDLEVMVRDCDVNMILLGTTNALLQKFTPFGENNLRWLRYIYKRQSRLKREAEKNDELPEEF